MFWSSNHSTFLTYDRDRSFVYIILKFQMAFSIFSALILVLSCTVCHVSAAQQRGITLQDRISNMEEIMLNENLLIAPLLPCGINAPASSGEQTAAEWVRIVFHDFVTANVAAGTGCVSPLFDVETKLTYVLIGVLMLRLHLSRIEQRIRERFLLMTHWILYVSARKPQICRGLILDSSSQ